MPSVEHQITFLYTRDLAVTAHFYEQVMGLALALDQGTCRIYRIGQGGFIGFCQRDDAPQPPPDDVIITLVTPEVDEWYHALSESGVVVERPPALNPVYNIYHLFLRDPNGYLIEIQRFNHPFP